MDCLILIIGLYLIINNRINIIKSNSRRPPFHRLQLFTCKKYDFLVEKSPKSFHSHHLKLGNSDTALPMVVLGRSLYGRKFYRRFVVIPTIFGSK